MRLMDRPMMVPPMQVKRSLMVMDFAPLHARAWRHTTRLEEMLLSIRRSLHEPGVRTNTGHCFCGDPFAPHHSSMSPRTRGRTKGRALRRSGPSHTEMVYNPKALQCNKNAALVAHPTPVRFTHNHRGRFAPPTPKRCTCHRNYQSSYNPGCMPAEVC